MAASFNEPWRRDILAQLAARNAREREPFADLVDLQQKLAEKVTLLDLELKTAKISAKDAKGSSSDVDAGAEAVNELKRKIYSLQEELTELHRRKGENAQQVIDLSAKVKDQEAVLSEKTAIILSQETEIERLTKEAAKLKADMQEIGETNQLLKDEYQALSLALNSAEKKLREAKTENDRLLVTVIELKEKDVARMNQENEAFRKAQQEKMEKQLEEAAKEAKAVVVKEDTRVPQVVGSENLDSLICYAVRIPTRAYLRWEAHDSEVNCVKWSPHGSTLVTAGGDRKLKLWDISKGSYEQRGVLSGNNGAVVSLDFDAAGTLVLAASFDSAARVWSVEDSRLRHTLTGHSAKVFAAKFMGDNSKVASGSHDRSIRIWDLKSKACQRTFLFTSSCNDLVCSDQVIISGHFDKKIRFYDVRSASYEPSNEVTLNGRITSLDLDKRQNQYLLACTRDDALVLLDLRSTDRPVAEFRADGFKVGCDWTRAVLSPDAEYATVGSADGSVFIWNVNRPERLETRLQEHENVAIAAAWQPAGNCLVTCDKGKNVVVWADI